MKHRRLLPLSLALAVAVMAPVATSSGDPTAVAAKKKCKKAAWKCAPKRIHLSASGIVDLQSGSEFWKAEIDMRKWRASVGQVQYAQVGGTLNLRASWAGMGPTYELRTCEGDVRYDVPAQTLRLGKGDGFRFNAFLTFYLIGGKKNKYDFIVADAYELAPATGTQTCLSDSSQASFTFWLIESRNFEVLSRGRPGARRLQGSRSARGDSIEWTITRK